MSKSFDINITHEVGLHARPAAMFVKVASQFKSKILVENLSRESAAVNARSILSVLSIGVNQNNTIRLTIEGEDEEQAMSALQNLISGNFAEFE
ncbi:MAG: HPr family phosphocarrier protein [Anaerolineales bacterium]|nr:MAG: HPr family phosphocarrier protein [Anaerolineales bacterium]